MATETDKVNNGALATLTLVGTAATVAIALAVTALVRYEAHSVTAERSNAGDAEVRALKAGQQEKLNANPAWSDKTRTKINLPIERAMGLVVSDLQKDPRKATPPAPPGVDAGVADAGDAGAEAADAGDAGAGAADAGTEAADAAAPVPEGAAPTEAPKPEVPKPEEKKKPKPGGTVGGAPIVPSPVAPPSPALPSQP
jgi:hypothetical protein